jgi:hypothetical protein
VDAAAAGGAPILCVGTRRTAVIRTETAPRRAMIRVRSVVAFTWRVALKPVVNTVMTRLPVEATVGLALFTTLFRSHVSSVQFASVKSEGQTYWSDSSSSSS